MNRICRLVLSVAAGMLCNMAVAQVILIHSHNDYAQTVPFYQAYSQKVNSIEVDLFLSDGKLLVGHDPEDLDARLTFEEMYVGPIVRLFDINGGKAWKDSEQVLQLMVELKSDTHTTLDAVAEVLGRWPEVFDQSVNPHAVRVVITGNVPEPDDFSRYPEFISFDGIIGGEYSEQQLGRIALFSGNFRNYSGWNGKGSIVPSEKEHLLRTISEVHALGKPVRFWNAPEGVTVYYTFLNLGIDYINTDRPEACAAFFSDFANKTFVIGGPAGEGDGVTGTAKLDRTTRDFSGFREDRLYLSGRSEVYEPSYASDGRHGRIRNVIFLIGDGMGLNQITAGAYANGGLSILGMRHIGFQINTPKGEFTTDSAAGGSALATGRQHANRHIAAEEDGTPVPSLSEYFHNLGRAVGVVTLGNVADATPAAFYGHCVERDSSDTITRCLLGQHIDLLCGSGKRQFEERGDGIDLIGALSEYYAFEDHVSDINNTDGKVICIDERMDEAAEESNIGLLAEAVRESIGKLQGLGRKGFFLMVEGAKIDYAGHSNCLPGSVIETLSFDLAVAEALRFADSNGETLVVVTADHETGGLTLLDGDSGTGRVTAVYVTDDHTPAMLPVFAYGPNSGAFCGTYMNTAIAGKIRELTK